MFGAHKISPHARPAGPIAVFFFLALMLSTAIEGHAEPYTVFTVRMKGSAEGVGLSARKLAIEDAQHQVMVDVLQSMTNSSDLSLFNPVLRQASRYIQRYDLLRSDVVGQMTEVEIDAHVLERPLRHDIAAIMLPRLPRKPSVRLVLAEFIGPEAQEQGPTFSIAEEVIRKPLEDFGFRLTGIHDVIDHVEVSQLLDVVQGDLVACAAFARAISEDVLVVGSVTTSHDPLASGNNMLRNRARVIIRVFSGPDGKLLDTLTAEAVVQSVDYIEGGTQAVQDACGKLTGECVVAIVLAVLGMEDENRVLVRVDNPRSEAALDELYLRMQGIDGVSGIELLFYSNTLARIAVDYSGTMAFFSDMLSGLSAGGRKVEVTRSVRREVTLTLR